MTLIMDCKYFIKEICHLLAGHGATYAQVCQVAVYLEIVQLAWKTLVLLPSNLSLSLSVEEKTGGGGGGGWQGAPPNLSQGSSPPPQSTFTCILGVQDQLLGKSLVGIENNIRF